MGRERELAGYLGRLDRGKIKVTMTVMTRRLVDTLLWTASQKENLQLLQCTGMTLIALMLWTSAWTGSSAGFKVSHRAHQALSVKNRSMGMIKIWGIPKRNQLVKIATPQHQSTLVT